MLLNFSVQKKNVLVPLFLILFLLPALSSLVIPFRALGFVCPDYGLLWCLIAVYGIFLKSGLLGFPFWYEWLILLAVSLVLIGRKRSRHRISSSAARMTFIRLLFAFLVLRTCLILELAATVILVRSDQASAVLLFTAALCAWGSLARSRPAPALSSRIAVSLLLLLASLCPLAALLSSTVRPYELLLGGALGAAWWVLFVRTPRFRTRFLPFVAASACWYALSFLLFLPDMLHSYLAYVHSSRHIHWITREEAACYDILTTDQGKHLFAAQGNMARYDPVDGATERVSKQFVGGQRMDADLKRGRIFLPSFMRYSPVEDSFEDLYVFDLDLNLLRTVRYPDCVGPLYVAYSPRRERLYYSCEASGEVVEYDEPQDTFHVLGRFFSPNKIVLDEQEERLFVCPILDTEITVFDLDSRKPVLSSAVVPPVYALITDPGRDVVYAARFVLGDMETRDLQTLAVRSRLRLDPGPRDMAVDREQDRLFTCNYFTGTLSIVDLRTRSVCRLFAGPRVRGIHYDPHARRLYFCSPLGIGAYDEASLSDPACSQGFLRDVRDAARSLFTEGTEPLRAFLASFKTLL